MVLLIFRRQTSHYAAERRNKRRLIPKTDRIADIGNAHALKKRKACRNTPLCKILRRRNVEMRTESARKMLAAVKKACSYLRHRADRCIILVNIPLHLGKLAGERSGIVRGGIRRGKQTEKSGDICLCQQRAALTAAERFLGGGKYPCLSSVWR